MRTREFTAIVVASALITFDGTAVTVALPAIARDLSIPFSKLQWIGNAPLLMLAALLLPAGVLADRFGRARLMRVGLAALAVGSAAAAAAATDLYLIAARLVQGAGGALILPGALAWLRAAFSRPTERARKFGVCAAWVGVASAIGPLLGGGLADLLSWRVVFALSATVAAIAIALLAGAHDDETSGTGRVPVFGTAALAVALSAAAYVLIEGASAGWTSPRIAMAAFFIPVSSATLLRSARGRALFPPDLMAAANCFPANTATFAMYFGMFGLSFLLVLYTQQALGYSGAWAGAGVLPISVMLFFAEPFGRAATRFGTRLMIAAGAVIAGAGILWIATGPDPLPFWSRIVAGTSLFGLGLSLTASALTHAAVSAVPEKVAGAASGFNHAVVRAAGLIAVAMLGSLAIDDEAAGISAEGLRRALIVCGVVVAAGGVFGAMRIRDDAPGGLEAEGDGVRADAPGR
jgi:MFS family permease